MLLFFSRNQAIIISYRVVGQDPVCHVNPPASFPMPSIDPTDLSSLTVTWQSVKVVTVHVEFLRTKVNAPQIGHS